MYHDRGNYTTNFSWNARYWPLPGVISATARQNYEANYTKTSERGCIYHKPFIFVHVTVNANMLASYDWYLYVVNVFQKIVERWNLFNGNFCFSDRGRLHCWYAYTTKLSSLCYLQVHISKKNFHQGVVFILFQRSNPEHIKNCWNFFKRSEMNFQWKAWRT